MLIPQNIVAKQYVAVCCSVLHCIAMSRSTCGRRSFVERKWYRERSMSLAVSLCFHERDLHIHNQRPTCWSRFVCRSLFIFLKSMEKDIVSFIKIRRCSINGRLHGLYIYIHIYIHLSIYIYLYIHIYLFSDEALVLTFSHFCDRVVIGRKEFCTWTSGQGGIGRGREEGYPISPT